MSNNSSVILIPARLNSSRFPEKILTPINGKPLIINVLERAQKIDSCEVYVACCSEKVKKIIEDHGGRAIVTDPELPSGTDRIFAALSHIETKPEFVVNLQGDNPVFDEDIIPNILSVIKNDSSIDMTTPVVFKDNMEDASNPNIVKVAFNNMENNKPGRALYFSRNHIPNGANYFYQHLGIYAYRYDALKKFVSLKASYLEQTERLEQLRALQNNMNVWAVPVDGMAISVDVEDDLIAVNEYLSRK